MSYSLPHAIHSLRTFKQSFQFGPMICTDLPQQWLVRDTSKKICLSSATRYLRSPAPVIPGLPPRFIDSGNGGRL
jgi:hypothetical protein